MTALGSDALRALDISSVGAISVFGNYANLPSCCLCISFFLSGLNLFFVEEVITSHSTLGPNVECSVSRCIRE